MMYFYMVGNGVIMMDKIIQLTYEANPFEGELQNMISAYNDKPFKVLYWEQVVDLCIEHDIINASVGLAEDWMPTCSALLDYGIPYDYGVNVPYGYCLASRWATPCLYDEDAEIAYECYYETYNFDWDKHAKAWWPNDTKERYLYERKED